MTKTCAAYVYVRDTYRLERGVGFRMHYTKRLCRRLADKTGYCWQHRAQAELMEDLQKMDRG